MTTSETISSIPSPTSEQIARASRRNTRRNDAGFWVLIIGVVLIVGVLLGFLVFNQPSEDPAESNRELLGYLPFALIGLVAFVAGSYLQLTQPHKPADQPAT